MRDQALLAEYFCLNLDEETRAQVEALAKEENVTPQEMSLILLREALYRDLSAHESPDHWQPFTQNRSSK